jgi:WD40 repeat protein
MDEPVRNKPCIRKLVEQPWQETKAGLWENVADTLCNLQFIEAKCAGKLTFDLIDDYNNVLDHIPENLAIIKTEREQRKEIDNWTREIIEYSSKCIERGSGSYMLGIINKGTPQIPDTPLSCRIWTTEEIENETKRISDHPTRLDKLKTFFEFVSKEFQSLNELNDYPDFTIQHAFNYAPDGLIHKSAELLLSGAKNPIMLHEWSENEIFNSNPALIKTLEGHRALINCVDMTPNGRFIVTGCSDSSIRLWDSKYGKCIREINIREYPITNICMTPDCSLALAATSDKMGKSVLQLWNLLSGNCLQILAGHTSKIVSLSITPDGTLAVSAGADKTIRVWNMKKGTCLHVLEVPGDEAACVCLTIDGMKAVSAGGNYIRIWDVAKGKLIKSIEGGKRTVYNSTTDIKLEKIKITPDGKTAVVSNSNIPRCMVWDLETGKCIKEVYKYGGGELSITPDARYAMFPGGNAPYIIDLRSGEVVRVFEGHIARVTGVCISPDCKFGVSVDYNVKVWNIEKGYAPPDKKLKSTHVIKKLIISGNNSEIFSQTDWNISVWDLNTGGFHKQLNIAAITNVTGKSIDKFYITPDNERFVATYKFAENSIYIWDCKSDSLLHELKGHTGEINDILISSDSKFIVSSCISDNSVRAWEISSGICLWMTEAAKIKPGYVNISTDNKYVIYISDDGIINVIDTKNGRNTGSYKVSQFHSAFYDFGEIINDADTGIRLSLLRFNAAYILRDLINPDSICTLGTVKLSSDRKFAFESNVHFLTMWDMETVNCVRRFDNPHKRSIFGGMFPSPNFSDFTITPDAQYIISNNNDGSTRIWEIFSGRCIAAERTYSSCVAFSMATQKIVTGAKFEELKVYRLSGVKFKLDQISNN